MDFVDLMRKHHSRMIVECFLMHSKGPPLYLEEAF